LIGEATEMQEYVVTESSRHDAEEVVGGLLQQIDSLGFEFRIELAVQPPLDVQPYELFPERVIHRAKLLPPVA
jgi:hypothetical protein